MQKCCRRLDDSSSNKIDYYVILTGKDMKFDSNDDKLLHSVAVQDTKYGGKGLFATRSFRPGEIVFHETPFFKVPTFSCENNLDIMEDSVRFELNNPANFKVKKKFFALSDKYELSGQEKTAVGIIETNGLPMGEAKKGKPPEEAGMYEIMCRMNHSCVPNVHHQYNLLLKRHEIRCIRRIEAGEEILTNYFYVAGKTFEERQRLQKEKWNFNCCCTRCSLEQSSVEARVEGDKFEKRLAKLDEEIQFFSCFKPAKALSKCLDKIKLLETNMTEQKSCNQEITQRFYDPIELVRTYFDAFQICLEVEEALYETPHLIQKTLYWSVICRGFDHYQTQKYERLCLDPFAGRITSLVTNETTRDFFSSKDFVRCLRNKFDVDE